MKFILNLSKVQKLTKNELKQIKGGDYIYYLNGYEVRCAKPLSQVLTCENVPTYCLISPDMCPS
ncbi:bacteriocin [Flavobacterium sp. LC2016-13]|nr:bacteriocin [Flavobacterium sp. LC2016-13]